MVGRELSNQTKIIGQPSLKTEPILVGRIHEAAVYGSSAQVGFLLARRMVHAYSRGNVAAFCLETKSPSKTHV